MATCPSCNSTRLRAGYRTAPLPLRMIGIRTLLCDNCNFEFRAFALQTPKRSGGRRTKRRADVFNQAPAVDLQTLDQPLDAAEAAARRAAPPVHFDRSALPTQPLAADAPAVLENGLPADFEEDEADTSAYAAVGADVDIVPIGLDDMEGEPAPVSFSEPVVDLRGRIVTPPPPLSAEEPLMKLKEDLEERRKHGSSHTCPHCGSHDVNRRHRRPWQKMVFGLTSIRPYRCENCGGTFYARRQPRRHRDALTENEAELVKNSCFNQAESGQPLAVEQSERQHG